MKSKICNQSSMRGRLPRWVKGKNYFSKNVHTLKQILRNKGLNTVCESARCPNIGECFSRNTATFMILGDICTRSCGYCAVKKGLPLPVKESEPELLAEAVSQMGLCHVVITSVTRDDLPDGGSRQFADTVRALRRESDSGVVEVLTPDFSGRDADIRRVAESGPDIYNHNIETVSSLYHSVRPQADYLRSLSIFETVRAVKSDITTKSGFMVGLGESEEEVFDLLKDLYNAGCEMVTIGQYLRPGKESLDVKEYIKPDVFKMYADYAKKIGFKGVASAPLVRSSYNAELTYKKMDRAAYEPV